MTHLQGQRILLRYDGALGLGSASTSRRPVLPYIQARHAQGALRAGDQVAELIGARVRLVLARGQLPAPGCGGRVGNGERAERAAGEAQQDRGRILDGKAAGGRGVAACTS